MLCLENVCPEGKLRFCFMHELACIAFVKNVVVVVCHMDVIVVLNGVCSTYHSVMLLEFGNNFICLFIAHRLEECCPVVFFWYEVRSLGEDAPEIINGDISFGKLQCNVGSERFSFRESLWSSFAISPTKECEFRNRNIEFCRHQRINSRAVRDNAAYIKNK